MNPTIPVARTGCTPPVLSSTTRIGLRETVPDLALGLLTWIRFPVGLAVAAAAHLDVQTLAVHSGSLNQGLSSGPLDVPDLPELVTSVHASHRELVVWCPPVRRVRALAAAGVDALVVDDVSRHLAALARAGRAEQH